MDNLPLETLETIITQPGLSIKDVINLSSTSKYFRDIILNGSFIWKKLFSTRWPKFVNFLDDDFEDWFGEIQFIYRLSSDTHNLLSHMPNKFYKEHLLSDNDYEKWVQLLETSPPRAYNYIVYDLSTIIATSVPINSIQVVPVNTPGNKILQYYSARILRFIRQYHLIKIWKKFLSLPPNLQILETAAMLIAQWCQPSINIEFECVIKKLDTLAEEVIECLRMKYPDHPILNLSTEEMKKWKTENLEQNQWDMCRVKQIIECLGIVIYGHNKFQGNKDDALEMPEHCYINSVLEKKVGHSTTLVVIYEGVARRLGLKCDTVSFNADCLLKLSSETLDGSGTESFYIDALHNGDIVSKDLSPTTAHVRDIVYKTSFTREVVQYMLFILKRGCILPGHRNESITYLRCILELIDVDTSNDIPAIIRLGRIYLHHNVEAHQLHYHLAAAPRFGLREGVMPVLRMLHDYHVSLLHYPHKRNAPIKPKRHPSVVKYAVGMVMKHIVCNYKCVIYDWDPVFVAFNRHQLPLGLDHLKSNNLQPFYNVLVENESYQYVAEETLIPTSDQGLLYLSENIGRHFSHFFETHYVPNAEMEKDFPEDAKVRHRFHLQLKFENRI